MPSRVDANQPEIVRALRKVGAEVQHLHTLRHGCPDILVGFRGDNYLMEIKTPGGTLTDDEAGWHERWRGQVAIVYGVDDALIAIGAAS